VTNDARPLWLVLHGSAEFYGSDKVLLATFAELREDCAFKPVVILNQDGPLRGALAAAGVEVHCGAVTKIQRSMYTLGGLLRLPSELANTAKMLDEVAGGRRVGLVYSNTLAVLGGAVWARRRRLPHMWHVHEILQRPALVRKGLPWLADRLSDHVLANSRQTRVWLEREAHGLRDRVTTVFNGLGEIPPANAQSSAKVRALLGLKPGDVLATLAGRLNSWKGQSLLIEAMALLCASGRMGDLHVAIVGDVVPGQDAIRDRLLDQTAAAGLGSRVHFMPFVDDIWPIWHASDIGVVPSIEPEPFGMVAIEAMACGVPVVAAAHGGLVDIVDDGATGFLFPPRDAAALAQVLAKLSGDATLRARLGAAAAVRQARCFSLSTQVAQIRTAGMSLMRI
jgi:glycosyltransferase involved in cell wall biosynthesis